MNRLRYNDDIVNALLMRRGKRTPDWVLAGNPVAGGGHRCPAAPPAGAPLTFSRKDEASMSIAYEQGGRTNQKHRTRWTWTRSEEHTSELQSHSDLVCRLLLEKKKIKQHARAK